MGLWLKLIISISENEWSKVDIEVITEKCDQRNSIFFGHETGSASL